MSTNERDSDLPRLHVVVTSNFRRAIDDARDDPLVLSINPQRARAETKECLIRFVGTNCVDNLRGLQASTYAIHWTALRDAPPRIIQEIREIMTARRIPEISFLSGQGADRPMSRIPAQLVLDLRVGDLFAKARELANDDPLEAYSLLICSAATALIGQSGDVWEGFTDLDMALSQIREAAAARQSAPVTF